MFPCLLLAPPTPLLSPVQVLTRVIMPLTAEPHLPVAVVHWMGVPLHGQIRRNTCNGLKLPVRVRGTLARSRDPR